MLKKGKESNSSWFPAAQVLTSFAADAGLDGLVARGNHTAQAPSRSDLHDQPSPTIEEMMVSGGLLLTFLLLWCFGDGKPNSRPFVKIEDGFSRGNCRRGSDRKVGRPSQADDVLRRGWESLARLLPIRWLSCANNVVLRSAFSSERGTLSKVKIVLL